MVREIDRTRWRLCLALALLCSTYAVVASAAVAFPISEDLAVAQAQLPVGHPCKAPGAIDVVFVADLRGATGTEYGEAPIGVLVGGLWYARSAATGALITLPCLIKVDGARWARGTPCFRRRLLVHEVGHLGGLPDSTGLMSTYAEVRELFAVPGCPVALAPLRQRVTDRVLEMVPPGWEVACGARRGRVIHCTAYGRRSRVRRFRARLWDQVGASFTVVRVKSR